MKSISEVISGAQVIMGRIRLQAKDGMEMEIWNIKLGAQWLLDGKPLHKLAKECDEGTFDWDAYNYAFEIIYDTPRTEAVRF